MNADLPAVAPSDEARHPAGDEQLWSESWYFDFTVPDGSFGGWVRLGLYPNLGVAWYHALVCGPDRQTVSVTDVEVALPKGDSLGVRSHGLWADHNCETPLEHWSVANEAFGVGVDDPAELYGRARGDVVPLGLDLEWETDGVPYHYGVTTRYEVPCRVHGEVLVGDERIDVDGYGQRDHSWGERDWWKVRWLWTAGRLDDGTRFHASDIRIPDLRLGFGYVQPPGGQVVPVGVPDPRGAVVATEDLGDHGFPTAASAAFAGLDLDIEPLALAPVLLTGPDGQIDRFPRALCRFREAGGRTGLGWSEWNQPEGT